MLDSPPRTMCKDSQSKFNIDTGGEEKSEGKIKLSNLPKSLAMVVDDRIYMQYSLNIGDMKYHVICSSKKIILCI